MNSQERGPQGSNGTNGRPFPARPRTILVLGGGGMRGMAHLGVLRAMERLGIVPDEIIGTSIGAVIGGLRASGLEMEELLQIVRELSRKDYFRLNILKFLVKGYRTASLYSGRNFHEFIRTRVRARTFADMKIPFMCNALSLITGAQRCFGLPGLDHVPVADAIYASSCLPGIFEPIELDGEHFIDGGIAETLPLRLARTRKAEVILAVDLSLRDLSARKPYRASLPHILFRAFEIAEESLNEYNLHMNAGPDVVLMKPKVGHLGLFDFGDLEAVVHLGEQEAIEMLTTHPLTRSLCRPDVLAETDLTVRQPRNYVALDVDLSSCIHCGMCAVTCATEGYAAVASGDVVRKVHNYECTRDAACQRNCPTGAIRLHGL